MNEIESLRACFAVEDPEMEKHIGMVVTYLKGEPQERLVRIVGVQKLWDYDEDGKYRFGVKGYTVSELEDAIFVSSDGTKHRLYGTYACSKSKLTFADTDVTIAEELPCYSPS